MVVMAGTYPFPWSVPTALAACALLLLRHKWPWLTALLCIPALLGGLGWPPAVVAFHRTGRATRDARVVITCVLLATLLPSTFVVVNEHLGPNQIVLTVAFAFFMSAAPAAIGALITTRQDLTTSLAETRRAREAELEAREANARSAERARIAREIHDAVGHHATLIAVESAALATTTLDTATRDTALRLRALAKESLAEMRAALGLLNVPSDDYDLPALITRARAAGLAVDLDDQSLAPLPPAVARAAFRVVQEALTNVTKHAPGANVQVTLTSQGNRVQIRVVNTPAPPPTVPPIPSGTGLHGLSERVRMLGGTLTATRNSKGGFAVEAVLPMGRTKVGQKDSTFGGSARNSANA
jgi:signal transduction histidine kinase